MKFKNAFFMYNSRERHLTIRTLMFSLKSYLSRLTRQVKVKLDAVIESCCNVSCMHANPEMSVIEMEREEGKKEDGDRRS